MTASTGRFHIPSIDMATAHYPTLVVSIVLAFGTSVLIAKVGQALALDAVIVNNMSSMALTSGVAFYHVISRRRGAGLTPAGIVKFRGFELPWLVAATLGALVIVAVANAGGMVGVLFTGTLEGLLAASIVAALGAALLVGRWIGVRADRFPLAAAIVSAYLARILGSLLDLAIIPEDLKQELGMTLSVDYLLAAAIGGTLWAIAALIGALLGRRVREAGYVAYLLRRIPPATRASVMEMVYDESKSLEAAAVGSAAPTGQA